MSSAIVPVYFVEIDIDLSTLSVVLHGIKSNRK